MTDRDIDQRALRAYRLGRVREELVRRDYAAAILYDPINIRYATGTSNMQVWVLHNPARYVFVPADGPVVLFEFHGSVHLSDGIETVDEVRPTNSWYYFAAGPRIEEKAKSWAAEIADLVATYGRGNRRVAVDRLDPAGCWALQDLQITIHSGQEVLEQARCIKAPVELEAMKASIAVCEESMRRMHEALKPGITENELWSVLHQTNIARRRVDRDAIARFWAAHQPLVPGMRRSGHRDRGHGQLRHRPDRPVRLLCGYLARLAVR